MLKKTNPTHHTMGSNKIKKDKPDINCGNQWPSLHCDELYDTLLEQEKTFSNGYGPMCEITTKNPIDKAIIRAICGFKCMTHAQFQNGDVYPVRQGTDQDDDISGIILLSSHLKPNKKISKNLQKAMDALFNLSYEKKIMCDDDYELICDKKRFDIMHEYIDTMKNRWEWPYKNDRLEEIKKMEELLSASITTVGGDTSERHEVAQRNMHFILNRYIVTAYYNLADALQDAILEVQTKSRRWNRLQRQLE
jgi:hypothetical protein